MGFFFKTQLEKLAKMSKKTIAASALALGIFLSGAVNKADADVLTQKPWEVPGYSLQFVHDGSYVIYEDHKCLVFTGLDAKKRAEEAAKKFSHELGEKITVVQKK